MGTLELFLSPFRPMHQIRPLSLSDPRSGSGVAYILPSCRTTRAAPSQSSAKILGLASPLETRIFFRYGEVKYSRPSGPNARASLPSATRGWSVTSPSRPILNSFLVTHSQNNTSPFALGARPTGLWYPSETSDQPSPGTRISRNCGEPAPALTGAGQSFHSQRMASGKTCVACLTSCPPSPQAWLTS